MKRSRRPADPAVSASVAGLRYVRDDGPGVRRRETGRFGFRYIAPSGRVIRAKPELERIAALAVPPAWTDVWICADPRGHLQATGRDARGRKQYRYHPQWRACRDETKYDRMQSFAAALPRIRARTTADLARPGLPREKVLAAVVQLLEKSLIRVGNDEYARDNGSFGLTTLRNAHVQVRGATVRFEFRGKSRVRHAVVVSDRRLARIVKQCRDLPGQELFEYVDGEGRRRDVTSGDVNAYLKDITGEEFTAKDFRTWAGTVLAAVALREVGRGRSEAASRKEIVRAIDAVAGVLGNTRSVCRKSYIHPAVIEAYADGSLPRALPSAAAGQKSTSAGARTGGRALRGLRRDEVAVLSLLQRTAAARSVRKRRAA